MNIDIIPRFKPLDPPPEGYIAWHEWAKVQHRAGLRQRKCSKCLKYRFSREFASMNVCNECQD